MLTQPTRQKTCCGILRKDAASRNEHELTLLSAVMREVPQFNQLDTASLKAICRKMFFRRYAKGDVIVQEGEHGNEFYVLIIGAVSIYVQRDEPLPELLFCAKSRPRQVDFSVAKITDVPGVKVKSRTQQALNRRISYTVDWDALEQKTKTGGAESPSNRRGSAAQEAPLRRGSVFSDSESEEETEDMTQLLRGAKSVPRAATRRLSRRMSSEPLEEKSPRKGVRTAALLPGSSFGEFSLLPKLPRQSTAKCEEKCAVAILRREDYQQILEETRSTRRSDWLAFAQRAPVLRNLDQSARLLLEPLVKILQISKGQKVVKVGDPLQVFFVATGVFEVATQLGETEMVTSSLMVSPACFGLSAHCRNDTHFQESLTCSASGKLYILQIKHLWMMLSSPQQDALTRAASYERWFHLARATVIRAFGRSTASRQLYAPKPRLAVLRQQLQETSNAPCEDAEALRSMLAKSWSKDSLVAEEDRPRKEKLPRLEPDLSRVAAEDVPKTRLHSSLLPLWSSRALEERQSLHLGQELGVFHGYGPPVQANRFITQFFKVPCGPWSHAWQSSTLARPKALPAAAKGQEEGEQEDFFEPFEDDGGMSPLLDAKIKETLRQRRLQEESRQRAERAASTLQSIVRRFLRHRRKMNHAAACIQRVYRSRKTLELGTLSPGSPSPPRSMGTPSATPEAELGEEVKPVSVDLDHSPAHHGQNILQLDFDTTPKLQDLKKALSRANRRARASRAPTEESVASTSCLVQFSSPDSSFSAPLFVPLDLIEKHRLLMETQELEDWPNADQLPTLKRLRRNWENLHRKPSSSTEVVPAPPIDLGALKLPVLPSPRGNVIFSARLSAAHADYVGNWNRGARELEKDEIDPAEIYRPRPSPARFRSTYRRG